ncbi:MAG TPA: hypothetical protein VD887_07775 [Allosphingosinicella sp.]|nr:hypothetical protein [Allosphingosinicella sp.]
MKNLLLAVAGVGVGGAAWFGSDSPDFDQVVSRSPAQAYAAFSALAQEGTIEVPEGPAGDRKVTIRVEKELGESIRYEILFDDRPVVTVDLGFAVAGEGEGHTRLTAELDLDAYELGSAVEMEGGEALVMVPEFLIDMQFAELMRDMVEDLEAGRSLPPLALDRARVRARGSNEPERRADAERGRRAASRPMVRPEPMMRPEPMVDPEGAARGHRNGTADGRWGSSTP